MEETSKIILCKKNTINKHFVFTLGGILQWRSRHRIEFIGKYKNIKLHNYINQLNVL